MSDCLKCRDYRKCAGNLTYFTYQDIRWCPYQVVWIITYRETFLAGNWPPNPDISSYIDPQIQTALRGEGYFCKAEEIIAEVEWRLKLTKRDGWTLVEEIDNGLLSIDRLSTAARDALMYVSGFNRKPLNFTYAQWLANRRARERRT